MRIFLFLLFFIIPMSAWACDSDPCDTSKIHDFLFNEEDLISWEPSIINIRSELGGKDLGTRTDKTILFHFKLNKAKELVDLTENIADPISTENNLAIIFEGHPVSELRIPIPLPQMDKFHLKVSDERYKNLITILPQAKMVSKDNLPLSIESTP